MKTKILAGILLLTFVKLTLIYGISISGNVIDANNQSPIDSAKVEIINRNSTLVGTVFTNVMGNWAYTLTPSSVQDNNHIPGQLNLEQNHPNPFNPATVIRFSAAEAGEVLIVIHNVLGQIIDMKKQFLTPGYYHIKWESCGSAGVYFYTIITRNASATKKMIQLDSGTGSGLSEIQPENYQQQTSLYKTTEFSMTLIISKFGYIADTLTTNISGGEYFTTPIETIHSHATMIDLHNDILYKIAEYGNYHLKDWHNYNHTDIPRLKQGGVDMQFFVVWISPTSYPTNPYSRALDYIGIMNSEFGLNANEIQQARALSEALSINANGKIAGIMVVEGGHAIENSIDNLINLYNAGMRYMTITWNNSTDWAVAAKDPRSNTVGLSDFGKTVIHKMDSLGIIIDVSHTGFKTIKDILEITTHSIIASHSGVRKLVDHYRNLYDDQIIAIANTGGVIGIVFYPYFLSYSPTDVNISAVITQIDYIVNLVGIDFVAIGSDFDGIEITPIGLEDTSKFPDLTMALLRHGYSRTEIEKILGGNFMRVFQEVCNHDF